MDGFRSSILHDVLSTEMIDGTNLLRLSVHADALAILPGTSLLQRSVEGISVQQNLALVGVRMTGVRPKIVGVDVTNYPFASATCSVDLDGNTCSGVRPMRAGEGGRLFDVGASGVLSVDGFVLSSGCVWKEQGGLFGCNGDGGLIRVKNGGRVILTDTVLQYGQTTSLGGAMHVSGAGSKVELAGCLVEESRASSGGGIAVVSGAMLEMRGTVFQRNRASVEGGAVFSNQATVEVSLSTFVGNFVGKESLDSSSWGGAISVSDSTTSIVGANFTENLGRLQSSASKKGNPT